MDDIKLIGPDEWSRVLELHSINFPSRDVDSLRRKYTSCYRKKAPTSDPNVPEEIKLAKEVKRKMGDKAQFGGGEEVYDILENIFNGGNSDDGTSIRKANPIPVFVGTNGNNDDAVSGTTNSTPSYTPIKAATINQSTSTTSSNPSSNSNSVNGGGTAVSNSTPSINGLVSRGSGSSSRKVDFMELMMIQIQNESNERAFE